MIAQAKKGGTPRSVDLPGAFPLLIGENSTAAEQLDT